YLLNGNRTELVVHHVSNASCHCTCVSYLKLWCMVCRLVVLWSLLWFCTCSINDEVVESLLAGMSVDLNLRTFYRYFVLDAVHLSKELVILYKLHAVVS
ncbi:hypothetical protein M513_11759, partial [Trichuris suis]